jgi:diketogulonate reductase-like aldo/keto reductase
MTAMSRRAAARLVVRSAAGLLLARNAMSAEESKLGLLQRAIPSSGDIGITHYTSSSYPAVVKLLRTEKIDFVQINYSLGERDAGKEILPLAQDRGVAVLATRRYGGGDLFSQVRQKMLPDWATEFDCHSWAQFLLKWVAHPAVTCAIPATANVHHLEDNMQAGIGRLPNGKQRQRMVDLIAQL